MPRFFLDYSEIHEKTIALTGENAAHAKVLRLKVGDSVTVCDGRATDYFCTVIAVDKNRLDLQIDEIQPSVSEPKVSVSVYMAYAKSDKFDHVVQKATELGAAEIIAFPSERCVSRPDAKSIVKKLERWQKIAASAAEQSRRGRIPQVIAVDSYQEAISRAASCDLAINFYEDEHQLTLHDALSASDFQSIAILTGPEGGYTPEEIALSAANGIKTCTLGNRILRCETAPLCALSAIMYATGEF